MQLPKIMMALLPALLFGGTAPSFAQEKPPQSVRFGVEALVPPFESRNAQGELVGLNIELGNALCAELNTQCVWVDQDYATNVAALEAGRFDAIMPMSATAQRRQRLDFTQDLYALQTRLVARKGSGLLPTAASLKGKRVGVLAGTSREGFAQARWAAAGVTIRSFQFNEQLITSLLAGDIDATLQDTIEIQEALLKAPEGAAFEFSGPTVSDELLGNGVAIALRKSDTYLREQLDGALKRLKQNGQYQAIVERYLPAGDVVPQGSSPVYRPLEGLPFSASVRVGPTIFLSGILGIGPGDRLVEGGITGQTEQAMENLKTALARAGSSLDQVAKCTVILANIDDFASMNQVYTRYFSPGRLPARTTFAAAGLVLDARMEIECVAVVS